MFLGPGVPRGVVLAIPVLALCMSCQPPVIPATQYGESLGIEWVEIETSGGRAQQSETPILISRWEITNRQYENWDESHWRHPTSPQSGQPVTAVSWSDAAGFCRWLGGKSGCVVRLPTEAEWEKAAALDLSVRTDAAFERALSSQQRQKVCRNRGGPDSETWPAGFAWRMIEDFMPETLKGRAPEDMIGNVWEWCCEVVGSERLSREWGAGSDGNAVCRGGSVRSTEASVSSRDVTGVNVARGDVGFRVVILPTLQNVE